MPRKIYLELSTTKGSESMIKSNNNKETKNMPSKSSKTSKRASEPKKQRRESKMQLSSLSEKPGRRREEINSNGSCGKESRLRSWSWRRSLRERGRRGWTWRRG